MTLIGADQTFALGAIIMVMVALGVWTEKKKQRQPCISKAGGDGCPDSSFKPQEVQDF